MVIAGRDIRRILAERDIPVPDDDDGEILLDSLSVAWLIHMMESEFGVLLDPEDEDMAAFSSVAGIVDYANGVSGMLAAGPGDA